MTIPIETAEFVRGLLARGLSQRKAAEIAGVAKGTVLAISQGRWRPKGGSDKVANYVRDLLSRGVSHREAAKAAGVSRRTVLAISQERWRPKGHAARDVDLLAAIRARPAATLPRCPTCGAKALVPCLACALRRRPAEGACRGGTLADWLLGEPLGLDLHGRAKERYLEVRAFIEGHAGCAFTPPRAGAETESPPKLRPKKPQKRGPIVDPGWEAIHPLYRCIRRNLSLPFIGYDFRSKNWSFSRRALKSGRPALKRALGPLPLDRMPLTFPFGALREDDFRQLLGYDGPLSDAELDRLTVECGIDLAQIS